MDLPSKAIVDVLSFLLPGFITAAVYYTLTPSPRPIPFERVVQALIFTMFVQVVVFFWRGVLFWLGDLTRPLGAWTTESQLTWSVIAALGLGVGLAWTTNRDKLHTLLRKLRITHQTSFPSEWYGALSQNKGYTILHLKGSRRLYGWPVEWPSVADKGHFVMAQAEWIADDNSRIPLPDAKRIVVRADEVEMVELMNAEEPAPKPESHDGRSQGTDTTTAPATIPAGAGFSSRLTAPAAPSATVTAATAEKVNGNG